MTGEPTPTLDYANPPSKARNLTTAQVATGALLIVALVSAYSTYVLIQPHGWTPEYASYMALEVAERHAHPSYVPPKFSGQISATESMWKQYTTYIAFSASCLAFVIHTFASQRTGSAG